jgi:hypothetical protein
VQLHDVRTYFKELETYHGHQNEVTGCTYFLPCLFSPTTMFWDLKFATPVQLHKCRSAMEEIKLRKNYHCLFHVYWSTKLSLPLITGLAPTSRGAVCQWKLWWQHDSLAGRVMTTFPSSHLSEASCCLIWKGHRYGQLWFSTLVLFLQWGHQAVRKPGFH